MQVTRIHRQLTRSFDEQQIHMVYHQEMFLDFLQRPFSRESFKAQINEKELSADTRAVLVESLQAQYADLSVNARVQENIHALAGQNTYTVVTGHQLSLFTGPLYFVLKIMHAIRLSEEVQKMHPDKKIVPVYWMATEDHDFEEVKSAQIFTKTVSWESTESGAVGRFSAAGLEQVKEEIAALFANHPQSEIHSLLSAFDETNYAKVTRALVHRMFAHFGLVIVDGDDPALKRVFLPVIEKELREQFSYKAVSATNTELQRQGGKIQVNPREINLFYLQDQRRVRIVAEEEGFSIDGVGKRTLAALLDEAQMHPERFSPNVILRPVYQEMILPNLAYIGGLGEIAYWLQLKRIFGQINLPFPLLNVRNSVLWIDAGTSARLDKLQLHLEDIFLPGDQLKRMYIEERSGDDMKWDRFDELTRTLMMYMDESVAAIDPSKQSFADGEKVKLEKQMDGFRDKLIRFAKSRSEESMKQIDNVKDRLFPGGGLQERKSNFFSFCPDGNFSSRLDLLHAHIDPFDGDLIVIREN
jgi:bacillithiol biosynthesis cysteine-adding enzyme BshC